MQTATLSPEARGRDFVASYGQDDPEYRRLYADVLAADTRRDGPMDRWVQVVRRDLQEAGLL